MFAVESCPLGGFVGSTPHNQVLHMIRVFVGRWTVGVTQDPGPGALAGNVHAPAGRSTAGLRFLLHRDAAIAANEFPSPLTLGADGTFALENLRPGA